MVGKHARRNSIPICIDVALLDDVNRGMRLTGVIGAKSGEKGGANLVECQLQNFLVNLPLNVDSSVQTEPGRLKSAATNARGES